MCGLHNADLIICSFCGFTETGLSLVAGVEEDLGMSNVPRFASETPQFAGPIENVTVPLGREAVLSCTVTQLGHYKVGLAFN